MILVFSCGRTGTNLVLEILNGSPSLKASNPPEDKLLFHRDILYPEDYLTKCDTVYCKSYKLFKNFLENNPNSKIVWTIRDPRDMILSKLYRGWNKSDDGNPQGCLDDMYYMYYLYINAISDFRNNIITVKMEDVISDITSVINKLTKFVNIPIHKDMFYPYKYMRHEGKKSRYIALDKSQIELWKRYTEIYDGFFSNKVETIETMFRMIDPLMKYFKYRR